MVCGLRKFPEVYEYDRIPDKIHSSLEVYITRAAEGNVNNNGALLSVRYDSRVRQAREIEHVSLQVRTPIPALLIQTETDGQ